MRPIGYLVMLGLAACAPAVPDSGARSDGTPADIGAGVGFGDYDSYEQARIRRERALEGGDTADASLVGVGRTISSEELSAAGLPVEQDGAGAASGPSDASASATPVDLNNPGISNEQNFKAVAERETIESDRARLERQRAAYRVIEPEPVPRLRGSDDPNIVQYALNTSNRRGEQLYSRSGFFAEGRFRRNCAEYASADKAQADFLREGGPEEDSMGLDPDGDGFACYWDPAPYRAVLN